MRRRRNRTHGRCRPGLTTRGLRIPGWERCRRRSPPARGPGYRVPGHRRRRRTGARPRWAAMGELAGLQVGDRIAVPGPGVRLQRSVLASSNRGELFVDTLKGKRSRTVPLVHELVPLLDAWSAGKTRTDWLFAPHEVGRSARRTGDARRLGSRVPGDRTPDLPGSRPAAHLRVTVARGRPRSEGGAADPGARLCRDDHGPLWPPVRHNLWAAAEKVGAPRGAPGPVGAGKAEAPDEGLGL